MYGRVYSMNQAIRARKGFVHFVHLYTVSFSPRAGACVLARIVKENIYTKLSFYPMENFTIARHQRLSQNALDGWAYRSPHSAMKGVINMAKTTKSAALQKAVERTTGKTETPPVVQDQKVVQTSDKETSSKPKGNSAQVQRWKAEIVAKSFGLDAKITVPAAHKAKNPKLSSAHSRAGDRFALYTDGMTVKRYQELCKEKFGRSPAAALADVRWDKAAGFITVS